MKDLNIEFPLGDFEKLISQIGWSSLDEWFMFWNLKKEILSIEAFWDENVNDCLLYTSPSPRDED